LNDEAIIAGTAHDVKQPGRGWAPDRIGQLTHNTRSSGCGSICWTDWG